MNSFLLVIIITILLISLDMLWFSISLPTLYNPMFEQIQQSTPKLNIKMIAGLYAWLLLAIGIVYLVQPLSKNYTSAFLYGALFGLIVYGVYNGTNYATINNWNLKVFFFDNLWGIFICGFFSLIAYVINKQI